MNDTKRDECPEALASPFRFAISVLIAAVLGLQLLAGLGKRAKEWWPFLEYPMYRTARSRGEEIPRYVLHGVQADSSEIELSPADFGLNPQKFRKDLVGAVLKGDEEAVGRFADIYAERTGGMTFAGLRLERRSARWENGEVVRLPAATVVEMEFAP
jgi:hypothetical protein